MTTYCYTTPDGQVFYYQFPMGKAPREVQIGDVVARRDYYGEHRSPFSPPGKGWPIECVASGVNAADADKLRKLFVTLGVPTEVSEDGNPIYRDPAHRRKALRARGFHDRSDYR